jgi:peptidoglycan hydrolase-like protein with peptidoglycan-binding domain
LAPDHDLSSPVPWRRSQRASAERRARAARSRRRRLRGRACTLLAVALTGAVAGGAMAADAGPPSAGVSSSGLQASTVQALQQKLGVSADGVYGPRTRAAVRRFQRRSGLAVDGVAGPRTLAALGLRAGSEGRTAGARRPAPTGTTLARIAQCESGSDPTAVSQDGAFRGKYQFTRSTWRAMGGTGDPAKAAEAEQDRRAAALLARAGTSPWPVCGR